MFARLVIVQVVLLTFQILLYFGCEKFQQEIHDVKRPIDDRIPFLPFTVLPYCLWFPMVAFFPFFVYYTDVRLYAIYMTATVLEIVFSVICYLVYPTTFTRPVPPDTFFGNCMKLVYKGSYRGVNCAPSLHCSSSFLVLWIALADTSMPLLLRVLFILLSLSIVLSTMTTKQHTVIDVVTGAFMFMFCLFCTVLLNDICMTGVLSYVSGIRA